MCNDMPDAFDFVSIDIMQFSRKYDSVKFQWDQNMNTFGYTNYISIKYNTKSILKCLHSGRNCKLRNENNFLHFFHLKKMRFDPK